MEIEDINDEKRDEAHLKELFREDEIDMNKEILSIKDANVLLVDYITNLEQENERLNNKIEKALDKLYCYGEVFNRKILQDFQKEMIGILVDGDE